jgi:hypothetical protein
MKSYDTWELTKALAADGVFTLDQAGRLVELLKAAGLIGIGADPPPDFWKPRETREEAGSRPGSGTTPPEPDALQAYIADVLKRAGEERVTRAMLDHVVRDLQKTRGENDYWQGEVGKLQRRLQRQIEETERRLTALEERACR